MRSLKLLAAAAILSALVAGPVLANEAPAAAAAPATEQAAPAKKGHVKRAKKPCKPGSKAKRCKAAAAAPEAGAGADVGTAK